MHTFQRLGFILILLAVVSTACKKKKEDPIKDIQPIDIQSDKEQAIHYGALTIYPIRLTSDPINDISHILPEVIDKKGFNIKSDLVGNGRFSMFEDVGQQIYLANKTDQEAIYLYGDLMADAHHHLAVFMTSDLIPAKKIKESNIFTFYNFDISETDHSKDYLFPCPTVPLKHLFSEQYWKSIRWVKKALPQLEDDYTDSFAADELSTKLLEEEVVVEDEDDDDSDTFNEPHPMNGLESLDDFTAHFERIGLSPNYAGCLVTYKNKVLASYLFANPKLFRKEWPYLLKSIYLNQLIGFTDDEFEGLSEFDDLPTTLRHVQDLWKKKSLKPDDQAFRGERDGEPYYLVWF